MSDGALRHVVIAVPTIGARPLDALLRTLVDQAERHPATVEVVVLDNGATVSESARAAATAAGAHHEHVAGRGVASVRNAALDLAAQRGADALVFIDDDELPVDEWLASHVAAAERFGADVVLGPVPVRVPDDAPRWLDGGRALRTVPDRADGPFDDFVNAGNTLVRLELVQRTGVRFDTAFDSTGGEDTVFFSRLRSAGAVVVWSRTAVAVETQDADRLTLGGYTRRLYEVGQRSALVERNLATATAAQIAPRRVFRILRGAATGVGGVVTARPERAARGLGEIAFGWGSLTALAGRRPTTYAGD